MLRAECVLLSVLPELTSAIEVERVVAAGTWIARERVLVFLVIVKNSCSTLGVGVEWPVYVALVAGCTVVNVDKGVVDIVPMVADCMPGAGAEERTLLVGGINTVVLLGEEMLDIPESHTSVAAPEEVTEGAVVISVRRDSVGRAVVGFSVESPASVAPGVGKGS